MIRFTMREPWQKQPHSSGAYLNSTKRSDHGAKCNRDADADAASPSAVVAAPSIKRKSEFVALAKYQAKKSTQWKQIVSRKPDNELVAIQIGLLERGGVDFDYKPVRGQTIMVKVGKSESVESMLHKAQRKYFQFFPKSSVTGAEYCLSFKDGQRINFLPGTEEPFSLAKYKEDIGKQYNKIVLYLLKVDTDSDEPQVHLDSFPDTDTQSPLDKALDNSIQDPFLLTNYPFENLPDDDGFKLFPNPGPNLENYKPSWVYDDVKTASADLEKQVNDTEHLFIVARRTTPIHRHLTLWNREVKKKSPDYKLSVKFEGESGIDSGALAREFFSIVLPSIRQTLFPDGAPIDSMLYVENGFFKACGQIISASLVQGGPPPLCFHLNVFSLLIDMNVDIGKLELEKHFTDSEMQLLNSISNDCVNPSFVDTILEHGYTGEIRADKAEDITRTLMISITNKRLCYLKAVASGLELFGLLDAVKRNATIFQPLFTLPSRQDVDANYVASLLHPQYSEKLSAKRITEEKVMDKFVDFLMHIEDNVVRVTIREPIMHSSESDEDNDTQGNNTDIHISPAHVLGWLTGLKHRPVFGEEPTISVLFEHDCMVKNPSHRICFPVVGACGRTITLPVKHLEDEEEFRSLFVTALSNGQAFGRH